jgi:hypothetical protein
MTSRKDCETPNTHDLHMCQLRQAGLMEEIDRRSAQATVVCNKCGARAKAGRDLCQPRPCRS